MRRHLTASPATPATIRSDASSIDAIRQGPVNGDALDALVRRHSPGLSARCRALARDRVLAEELVQETWCRMIQARHRLDPAGNLPGYLDTIATNLWRDRIRATRRAGQLADGRVSSLDTDRRDEHGARAVLREVVADPASLDAEAGRLVRMDVERALAKLAPQARDVLLARLRDGASAVEIGRRYGRTPQTITTWLRKSIRELRSTLWEHDPSLRMVRVP